MTDYKVNWDLTDTDMPYYNNLLKHPGYFERAKGVKGKVVYITPQEYMEMAADIHGVSVSREYDSVMGKLMRKYSEDMKRGDKFPIPVIDKAAGLQEGRTRVVAAEWLLVSAIPVLIVRKV